MSADNGVNAGQSRTIANILRSSTAALESRLEADLLVGFALGRERAWLYAHAEEMPTGEQRQRIDELIAARCRGVPIAQLLGEREFYGRRFLLDENVLIPRPESELLVDLALGLDLPHQTRVVDVGTGTGCIALSLAAERSDWQITAIDRSAAALKVAAANRRRLGLAQVRLVQSDLFDALTDQCFDLIVSNPPYVADADPHLERGDLRFEPRLALAGGPDGLAVIRRLVSQAIERLAIGGWLAIEHSHDQAPTVAELLVQAGFDDVTSHRDLARIERVTLGRIKRPRTEPCHLARKELHFEP